MLAFHGIFSAYGFWLPNDPRGSWSTWVAAWELFRYGGHATKLDVRHSLARVEHDPAARRAVKEKLKYPPVTFDGLQARAIGRGFAAACARSGYILHACAILPEHVHIVAAAHSQRPRQVVGHLKGSATQHLLAEERHPFQRFVRDGEVPMCWARRGWNVYLDHVADVTRAIRYVEGNPLKEGLPGQRWRFVVPFDPYQR